MALVGTGVAGAIDAGCSHSTRRAGALTVLINAEPEHLDPRFPGDALGAAISRLVYSPLLDSDPNTFEPRPALASSVEMRGDRVVRARLRPGLHFHDGSPLTARDVEATYRSILDPALRTSVHGTYAAVFARVDAVDPLTIDFTLIAPDGTYPSLLQQPIVRASDAVRPELATLPGNESSFVGSGPMRVRSLDHGAWTLSRVEPRPGGADEVRFLTMHDPNTLALRLLHGDADLAEIKPELFPLFRQHAEFGVSHVRSVGFTYVGLRGDHPLLAQPEARRAIAHAIDRHALRAGKFDDFAVDATGPLPPHHWAYTPDVVRYPYDPEQARTLLASARARAGSAADRPLAFRVSNVRFVHTTALAIAEMLGAVGIECEVRQSDIAALLTDLRAARYDATVLTMSDLSDPWGLGWMFSTSSMPTAENPRAGGNRWRYSNARLDEVLEGGRRALTIETRRPYYVEAQQILARELPVVPLWHADLVFASGRRVSNVRPRGDGLWDFLLDVRVG
jgi:peptide/nickel transport system substrate-binding protein